jgi:hypothetical protein
MKRNGILAGLSLAYLIFFSPGIGLHAAEESSTGPELSARDKLQFNTVMLIQEDLLQEQDPAARIKLLEEILDSSSELVKSAPDLVDVWLLRAGAALQLGRWKEGHEAGHNLIRLGLLNSDNVPAGMLMAKLNRKGWLDDDLGKIELREMKADRELKPDSDLPEAVRKELATIINQFSAGDSWDGYTRIKALRLKLGKEETLHYPLARRALALCLAVSAARGDLDLVRASLAAGASPTAEENGYSALYWAGFSGNADMVRLLIAAGADATKSGKNGKPILYEPIVKGSADAIELLLKGGANPNARYREKPLIQEAVDKGKPEIVKLLIDAGADVNAKSQEDPEPLFYKAIKTQNMPMAKVLAEGGADFDVEYEKKDMWYHARKADLDEMYDMMKDVVKKRKEAAKD